MGIIEESISEMILEKTEHWNFQDVTLSGKNIFVLSEIDGKKSIGELCSKMNIRLPEIKNIVNDLGARRLVRIVGSFDEKKDNSAADATMPDKKAGFIQKPAQNNSVETENISGHPQKTYVYRGISYEMP